jgi:hypothetical protein
MLDLIVLFATAAFILAGAIIGVRLLRLAARTRELTDFLVGFSLVLLCCVSYPLTLLATLADLSLPAMKAASMASTVAAGVGWSCVCLFTQRVFRAGDAWARALAWLGAAAIAVLASLGLAYVAEAADRTALVRTSNPAFWCTAIALFVYVWTSYEGFRCWDQARRRMKLGLAEPLVADRFLMWGFVGAFALLSVGPSFVDALLGNAPGALSRLTAAVGGLGASIALQLAFLPPASYRRWVERRAAAVSAAA